MQQKRDRVAADQRKSLVDAEKAKLAGMSAEGRRAYMLLKARSKFTFSIFQSKGSVIKEYDDDEEMQEALAEKGSPVKSGLLPWITTKSDIAAEALGKGVIKTTLTKFKDPNQCWAARQMKETNEVAAPLEEMMGKIELAPVWAACVAVDLFRKPDAAGSKASDAVLHAIGQAYAGPFPWLPPFGHVAYL